MMPHATHSTWTEAQMLKRLARLVSGMVARFRAASQHDAELSRRIEAGRHDPADLDREYELLIGQRRDPPPGGYFGA
jgi:hypothetical protein